MKNNILLITDESLSDFLEFNLKENGAAVQTASDGMVAEEFISQGAYSLIITDMFLPYISGLEIMDIIKKSDKNTDTPVLVLSELNEENASSNGFEPGKYDLIHKPISIEGFISKVNSMLTQHSKPVSK